jgi:membrane protease subunit (stomatin/prohibitin family)
MTSQGEIMMYCRALEPAERPGIMQGIESMFKWQPVVQMAQGLFSSYFTPSGGVSDDAKDLIKGGYVDAGVELMRLENQPQVSQMQLGMTPMQQMALCYACDAPAYCSQCGTKTKAGGLFCTKCGSRL